MSIGERIKYIRKDLKMTQPVFGDSLGISRDALNNLEHDRLKTVNDAVLKLICKTYQVNYFWLTEGAGEPYVGVPDVVIDEAVEKYQLDELDKKIIEEYVKLPVDTREALKKYLEAVFKKAPD